MFVNRNLYGLEDVTIVAEPITTIEHRGSISLSSEFDENRIPVFVSPMDCIVSESNFEEFENSGLIPILPRTVDFKKRLQYLVNGKWVAFGLDEFNKITETFKSKYSVEQASSVDDIDIDNMHAFNVCIDMANGHMVSLLDAIDSFNEIRGKIEANMKVNLMVGNIATPLALNGLEKRKVDYVRLAVGCGTCCTTTTTTGVNYPMASLIDECYKTKCINDFNIKLVADGGIKDASYAAKAYALGADYVMVGTTIGCVYEAASEIHMVSNGSSGILPDEYRKTTEIDKIQDIGKVQRMFRLVWGMSTQMAQYNILKASGLKKQDEVKLKQAEGISKEVNITCTLCQWVERFKFSLRSSMSYCNARNMKEFIGRPRVMLLSESSKSLIKNKK